MADSDTDVDIETIVNEINKDIQTKPNNSFPIETFSDIFKENYVDSIIILIIYVFLSLTPVRMTIGNFLSVINPDDVTGETSVGGIVIYGVILVTLIIAAKKIYSMVC